jgi:hypothetical protein
MTTLELIQDLREWAEVDGKASLAHVLTQAADRLEALDERVAIMDESYKGVERHLFRVQIVNIVLGVMCGIMGYAIMLLAIRG